MGTADGHERDGPGERVMSLRGFWDDRRAHGWKLAVLILLFVLVALVGKGGHEPGPHEGPSESRPSPTVTPR